MLGGNHLDMFESFFEAGGLEKGGGGRRKSLTIVSYRSAPDLASGGPGSLNLSRGKALRPAVLFGQELGNSELFFLAEGQIPVMSLNPIALEGVRRLDFGNA